MALPTLEQIAPNLTVAELLKHCEPDEAKAVRSAFKSMQLAQLEGVVLELQAQTQPDGGTSINVNAPAYGEADLIQKIRSGLYEADRLAKGNPDDDDGDPVGALV